ncbi:16S rRNA (cytosine(967)-C(5))-methyltransferase [Pantanalinema sp. GBBB05]|uniref:16S rRNA (cytosine(967)-C(5))-methyltransferase n=1 Tax=Pantanalinema sp. GBBB05 TaxID=2604139 RepID=UPI001DF5A22F|nr:16S rRNA (cytosine(967)-C(5))-methyltransferase [Pantanalinema sp. GBBB05]
MSQNPRQLAFLTLKSIDRGAFADIALDQVLNQAELSDLDRRLLTELVYGCVRRQRTLDALIDQLGKKPSQHQPPNLRLILHLGLYQLRYLTHMPPSAAVNTTVDLAKQNGFAGLSGVVNGLLRQYIRLTRSAEVSLSSASPSLAAPTDPLQLPSDPIAQLGILHSYPDWIVQVWLEQFGWEATAQLCAWMNQPPPIDLRINPLKTSLEQVIAAFTAQGIALQQVGSCPQALRLMQPVGAIQALPGFDQGWWMVQDSSAQLVSHLLNPQPGEVVIDACAAPGGKTAHIAELMGDRGIIWACDKTPSRLKKLRQNCDRLGLQSIRIHTGDSRQNPEFVGLADRVLLDAPCSGLGTLHRHADARWRQTPERVQELVQLQAELLQQAVTWVKPGGTLVYATCTLHPAENEQLITAFLAQQPAWKIVPPAPNTPPAAYALPQGWIKVLPVQHHMDGFFMVQLQQTR